MKVLFGTVAACAVFSFAGAVAASTVNLSFDGLTHGAIKKNVEITASPVMPPKGIGQYVAGGFKMSDNGGVLDDFIAFCLDIGNWLRDDTDYEPTATPFTNFTIPIARVQAVFDANYGGVDLTNENQSAGFQLALWEAIYDTDYDLTTGAFRGKGLDGATTAAAQGFLSAASSYAGPKKFSLTFYDSLNDPRSQNLVTVSPVPLPAGGVLLLSALGVIGLLRRRLAA